MKAEVLTGRTDPESQGVSERLNAGPGDGSPEGQNQGMRNAYSSSGKEQGASERLNAGPGDGSPEGRNQGMRNAYSSSGKEQGVSERLNAGPGDGSPEGQKIGEGLSEKPGESAQKAQGSQRNNNFTMIRVIATVFVFAGHMGMIRSGEPVLLGGFRLHELGVAILFLLSGYLITKSWMSDPSPLRYAIRRFFRLWPPFAVMVLIMVYVAGPLVSDLGRQGYFQSWYKTYLLNLRFFIIYAQPGVFADMLIPYATNGSLWTMPVEASLYVITPILVTVLRMRSQRKSSLYLTAALTGAACAFDMYLRILRPEASVVIYGTDLVPSYHLTVIYMIGILFTYKEVRKYLNLQVGCVAMCLLFVFEYTGGIWQYLMLYVIVPYFVFSLAFAPTPVFGRFGQKMELSYGIYLYGFFFQQLVISAQDRYGVSLSYTQALLLSAIPTLVSAFLSYYLVELPTMRLGKLLVKKLKAREQRRKV